MLEKIVILGIFMFASLLFSFIIRVLKISTNRQHKMIAGVCAGLSRASDMPVWWIRAFLVVFALIFGYGIIFYVSLWLFMLKEKNKP
ncbi:MAG: PspC domain-containing protein [Candidatus Parcubacteria bacterium]|nr:PspC domain-containing protein [Candidatus Parcubacteria bacterium]